MQILTPILIVVAMTLLLEGTAPTQEHTADPPPSPSMRLPESGVLFADDFSRSDLASWSADKVDVWAVRGGVLRADLPDKPQQRSILYAGAPEWADYSVDLDVCAMRGVDKGVVVRVVKDKTGIGVDLRGPGYHDVLLYRRQSQLGKARAINANGVWHHLRVEAQDHRYRVWVNDTLRIDEVDAKRSRPRGGIGLTAYTGGVGKCTVFYDNVVVTVLGPRADAPDKR